MKYAKRMEKVKASAIRSSQKKIAAKVANGGSVISFAAGLPDPNLYPMEELKDATMKVFEKNGKEAVAYGLSKGDNRLLKLLAKRMQEKENMDVDAENLLVVTGSQQGIAFSAMIFLDKDDIVIAENPSYLGAINAFRPYEPQFLGVDTDEDGIVVEHLDKILSENDVDILYGLVEYVHDISSIELNRDLLNNFKLLSLEGKKMLHTHMYHLGMKQFWRSNSYVSRGPVAKILKKSIMDNNLFNASLIFGEDEEWNFRILESQNYNMAIAYNTWYYYIFTQSSTLHRFRFNFIELSEQRLKIMQSFIWNTNDQVELMKEGFSVIKEIFYIYYFSKENTQSFFSINEDFNQLLRREIWKSIFRFDLVYKFDIALLIKYFLLYLRILPLILYLYNITNKKVR